MSALECTHECTISGGRHHVSARLLSLLAVVAALTCYHLAQRSMPGGLRPAPLFAFVYAAAALLMVTVVTVDSPSSALRDVADTASHWAPWLLVASVAGIELGVYAMYRAGWGIGTASTSTQAIVAAILVVVGLAKFGEHLTTARSAGLVLCVVGAGLVAH
jgi:drug/metabolite transporter (DMT)-like permease